MFSPSPTGMPPLVDPDNDFIAPPPGVSFGGQAFPGAAQQPHPAWPLYNQPTGYNPFPGASPSPGGAFGAPFSAPAGPPPASWHYPPFSATPALTWGATTPAASYGPPTPNSNPFPGAAAAGVYLPWSAPAVAPTGYPAFGGGGGGGGDGIAPGGFFGAGQPPASGTPGGLGLGVGWNFPDEGLKRKSSLKRSKSASGSRKHTPIQRSLSFGNEMGAMGMGLGGAMGPAVMNPFGTGFSGYPATNAAYPSWGWSPPYTSDDSYGPRNLARRPRDWRADYTPRGGLAAYLPNIIGRSRSDVEEYHDPDRRKLNPLLEWKSVCWDMRENPFQTEGLFPGLVGSRNERRREPNELDFAQLATNPAAPMMRLYHPSLPWYIDIRHSNPNGITVHDVLGQMWRQLLTQIHGRHFFNEDLTDEDREVITDAFRERCKTSPVDYQRGVVQLDFLGPKVIFQGLARGQKGMWEIKTRKLKADDY